MQAWEIGRSNLCTNSTPSAPVQSLDSGCRVEFRACTWHYSCGSTFTLWCAAERTLFGHQASILPVEITASSALLCVSNRLQVLCKLDRSANQNSSQPSRVEKECICVEKSSGCTYVRTYGTSTPWHLNEYHGISRPSLMLYVYTTHTLWLGQWNYWVYIPERTHEEAVCWATSN